MNLPATDDAAVGDGGGDGGEGREECAVEGRGRPSQNTWKKEKVGGYPKKMGTSGPARFAKSGTIRVPDQNRMSTN